MLRRGFGAFVIGLLGVGASALGGDAGCSATKPTELVPGATTQVQLPKDMGGLRVIVVANGDKVFDKGYTVGVNGIAILPATLGVVSSGSASTTVTVAMFGYKPEVMNNTVMANGQPVDCSNKAWNDSLQNPLPVGDPCGPSVERGSTQTYVDQRILFLPMPLSYSCWGNDSCTGSGAPGTTTQTCKGGQCLDNKTDPTTLADYDPALLDGTQDCFSPVACFPPNDTVSALALDPASCTYTFPSKPDKPGLNVRVFYEDLHYDMSKKPPQLVSQLPSAEEEVLDFEHSGVEGYTVPNASQSQTFKLAPGLCSLVQAGLDPVNAPSNPLVKIPPSGIVKAITDVQISPACQSKVHLLPFCANEQNPQGHSIDGGTSNVTCNVPIVLQPAPSAVYLVMDDSAVMSAAFGQQGYATAMSLSLADPIFKRTYVAFRFLDHSLSDCTAASTPYATPSVPFGLATDVQAQIAAKLLNVTPPDTTANPLPLNLQTALRLDQGAYPVVQALQTNQTKGGEAPGIGAVMFFVNRIPDSTMSADGGMSNQFPGADCSPALDTAMDTSAQSAVEQEITKAANAGLQTFFVVLNDDGMFGSSVLQFYDGVKADLGGKGVDVIDATSPKSQAQTVLANFSKTVTQLGTCLYELPPGVDTGAKLSFTIPVPTPATGGAAPVLVPVPQTGANPGSYNPNCNAANATTADGWNIENNHIRVCGASCSNLQATVEFVTAQALASGIDGGISKVPEVPVTVTVPCAGDGGAP